LSTEKLTQSTLKAERAEGNASDRLRRASRGAIGVPTDRRLIVWSLRVLSAISA
jgi:hypothetical protein